MKFSAQLSFLALVLPFTLATPTFVKRGDGVTDAQILNYALTLELLENEFYKIGLKKYSEEDFKKSGLPSWARARFEQIAFHEQTHVDFLTTALITAGVEPVKVCEYKFPDTNPNEFALVSEALETTGTSAYNGAARFIDNKDYLTVAASILAVEARHTAWVNSAVRKQNPWNTAFETPLGLSQVFKIASNFIVKCPDSNKALLPPNIRAFPALSLPAKIEPGKVIELTFDYASNDPKHPLFAAFIISTGTLIEEVKFKNGKNYVEVPKELKAIGEVFVQIVKGEEKADKKDILVTDDETVAGPALIMFPSNSEGKPIWD